MKLSKRIPLTSPIRVRGKTVSSLKIRLPARNERRGLRYLSRSKVDKAGRITNLALSDLVSAIVVLARIPPDSARELCPSDACRVARGAGELIATEDLERRPPSAARG